MERLRNQDVDGALPYFNVAAQQGHGPAALEMARMYDPGLRDRVASPLSKPNIEKAIAWYRRALAAGQTAAAERLRILEETR
jgi:TPR repeat protein